MHALKWFSRGVELGSRFAILTLFAATFLLYDLGFAEAYYYPKLAALLLLGAACGLWLGRRKHLLLPPSSVAAFLLVLLLAGTLAVLRSSVWYLGHLDLLMGLAGLLFLLVVLNASDKERHMLAMVVIAIAALESLLVIAQRLEGDVMASIGLRALPEGASGTIGNREFLATLLGFALILAVGMGWRVHARLRHRVATTGLVSLLLAGLIASRSKGTVLFLGVIVLGWILRRRPWGLAAAVLGGVVATAAIGMVFPDSMVGRLLLWRVALEAWLGHPLVGVGAGQFANAHFLSMRELFITSPELALNWGSHAAMTSDAHNLVLHWAAEGGVSGGVLAVAVLYWVARLIWHNLRGPLRGSRQERAIETADTDQLVAAKATVLDDSGLRLAVAVGLAMLLFKTGYTVVTGSVSGVLLLAMSLGWLMPTAPQTEAPRRLRLVFALSGLVFVSAWPILSANRALARGMEQMAIAAPRDAQAALDTALEHNPQLAEAHLTLAFLRFQRGERDAMTVHLDDALALETTIDSHKRAAHMFFYSRLYDRARPLYVAVLEAYPTHLTSMAKLALIDWERGERHAAREMAERLLRTAARRPNDSDRHNREIARELLGRGNRSL